MDIRQPGVSLGAGDQANLLAVRMTLHGWSDYLENSFSNNKVQIK